jgi:hypothetical protein
MGRTVAWALLSIARRRITMSRLSRRHEKLLRQYLAIARERSDAEERGASRAQIDRLAVRERALAGSLRRIRFALGLPSDLDLRHEQARLDPGTRVSERIRLPRRHDSESLTWSDRPRVRPVPATRKDQADARRTPDVTAGLVAYAARYSARRAADEVLEHRAARARSPHGTTDAAGPQTKLARTANGEIYAGAAGRLMGELVGRAFDGDDLHDEARLAVRCYIDEFTNCVIAALGRERVAEGGAAEPHDDESVVQTSTFRRQLAHASCERIAVEVRALRRSGTVTAADIAAIAGIT